MDPFDLRRFVAAQQGSYSTALRELERGRKLSHWMWFIFPQMAGLGQSETALFYGIRSADEARAYLGHALLGPRLTACTHAMLAHRKRRPDEILGPVDALKFRSSMTLFEIVAEEPQPFAEALDAFFAGDRDVATLKLLGSA